ncbi:MAG: hypothetical protein AB1515_09655 [Nitrospirota bacterium]
MADAPRRLLHLLVSPRAAQAVPLAAEQQRSGAGLPLLVIGPGAAGVAVPADIQSVRLADGPPAEGAIDYRELLRLIDDAASVSVW